MKHFSFLLLGLVVTSPLAGAQTLDPGFAPSAIYTTGFIFSAAEQPDGKRLVAGRFTRVNGGAAVGLSRFNADGTLDAAFQQNLGSGANVYRPRVLGNGQILLLSLGSELTAGGLARQSVTRLNADGTADVSFNPGAGATSNGSPIFVDDVLPLANGKMIVVGPFDRFNGTVAKGIVRLTSSGAVDPTFAPGTGADGEVEIIIGLPNGQLLIGGLFNSYDGRPAAGLARLNADGTFDATFTPAFDNRSNVLNLLVQPDGRILVAGAVFFAGSINGEGLLRLLPSGARDTSFSPPSGVLDAYSVGSVYGDALQLQADGKILSLSAGGANGTGSAGVIRLEANGSADASFQPATRASNTPYSATTLTLLSSGKVLLGGNFRDFNGTVNRPLLQLTSAGVVDPSFQPVIQTTGVVRGVVRQADGKLLAHGDIMEVDGQAVNQLVRFNANGGLDTSFSPATNGRDLVVLDVAGLPDGRVLVATRGSVLRLLASGALDPSFTYSGPDTNWSSASLLLQPDGRVLVAGIYGGVPSGIFRLNSDGSRDALFAPSTSGPGSLFSVHTLALQADGKIVVAGQYRPADGTRDIFTTVRLESTGAVDATFAGSPFRGPDGLSGLYSLAVQPDGKILVSGRLSAYGSTPCSNVVRLNANGSLDAGFTPPATTGQVLKVLLQPDNRLLIGGTFTGSGVPANLARLLPTGQLDATFGASTAPNGTVHDLLIQPDGNLVMSGSFSALGGQSRLALARLVAPNLLHVAAPRAVAERTAAWPVPAHTLLHVQPDPAAHPEALVLLDALGRPVRHQTLSGGATATLAVGALPAGTYLLRVTYAEGVVMRRIEVQ